MTEKPDTEKVDPDVSKIDLTNLEKIRKQKEEVAWTLFGYHLKRLKDAKEKEAIGATPSVEQVNMKMELTEAGPPLPRRSTPSRTFSACEDAIDP